MPATAPRSAKGRPQRSARPRPGRTGPRRGWPTGSGPATGAAASPAAPSPPCSATSTTSDPGPTDPPRDTNLLCLCRRHHRVKQRLGWTRHPHRRRRRDLDRPHRPGPHHRPRRRPTHHRPARRHPHTAATTDSGRRRAGPAARSPDSTSRARTVLPDGPHSELEFHLEHHGAPPPGHQPRPSTSWRDDRGRTPRRDPAHPRRHPPRPRRRSTPTTSTPAEHWPCRTHRARRPVRPHDHDPPPF